MKRERKKGDTERGEQNGGHGERERGGRRACMCLNKSGKGHMLSTRTFSQVTHTSYWLNVKLTSRGSRMHEFTKCRRVKKKRVWRKGHWPTEIQNYDSEQNSVKPWLESASSGCRLHTVPAGSLWYPAGCFSKGGGVLLIELGCFKAEHRFCVPRVGASQSLKWQQD